MQSEAVPAPHPPRPAVTPVATDPATGPAPLLLPTLPACAPNANSFVEDIVSSLLDAAVGPSHLSSSPPPSPLPPNPPPPTPLTLVTPPIPFIPAIPAIPPIPPIQTISATSATPATPVTPASLPTSTFPPPSMPPVPGVAPLLRPSPLVPSTPNLPLDAELLVKRLNLLYPGNADAAVSFILKICQRFPAGVPPKHLLDDNQDRDLHDIMQIESDRVDPKRRDGDPDGLERDALIATIEEDTKKARLPAEVDELQSSLAVSKLELAAVKSHLDCALNQKEKYQRDAADLGTVRSLLEGKETELGDVQRKFNENRLLLDTKESELIHAQRELNETRILLERKTAAFVEMKERADHWYQSHTELEHTKAKLERCKVDLVRERERAATSVNKARKAERRKGEEAVQTVELERVAMIEEWKVKEASLLKQKQEAVATIKAELKSSQSDMRAHGKALKNEIRQEKKVAKEFEHKVASLQQQVEKAMDQEVVVIKERDDLKVRCQRLEQELMAEKRARENAQVTPRKSFKDNLRASVERKGRVRRGQNLKGYRLPPSALHQSGPADVDREPEAFPLPDAVDVASESRSRFTENLPSVLNESEDEDVPSRLPSQKGTPAPRTRKRTRATAAEGPPDKGSRGHDSVQPETAKVRTPLSRSRRRASTLAAVPATDETEDGGIVTRSGPRKQANRKVRGKSAASGTVDEVLGSDVGTAPDLATTIPARRMSLRPLRQRKAVSYDYNQKDRDIVNVTPGFEVDMTALRRQPAVKTRKATAGDSPTAAAAGPSFPRLRKRPAKVEDEKMAEASESPARKRRRGSIGVRKAKKRTPGK